MSKIRQNQNKLTFSPPIHPPLLVLFKGLRNKYSRASSVLPVLISDGKMNGWQVEQKKETVVEVQFVMPVKG